jgi:predicted ABC-type ATPase
MKKQPKLIILGGVNGVGKSSFWGAMQNLFPDILTINPDKINKECGNNPILGGKKSLKLVQDCLNEKKDFAIESTLAGNTILKNIKKAKELGYNITLFYIGIESEEESLERIKNRVRKGGHNIPEEDVKRRYEKRLEDFMKVFPYCDDIDFYDNTNGFANVGFVLENLFYQDENFSDWAKPFEDAINKNGLKKC